MIIEHFMPSSLRPQNGWGEWSLIPQTNLMQDFVVNMLALPYSVCHYENHITHSIWNNII